MKFFKNKWLPLLSLLLITLAVLAGCMGLNDPPSLTESPTGTVADVLTDVPTEEPTEASTEPLTEPETEESTEISTKEITEELTEDTTEETTEVSAGETTEPTEEITTEPTEEITTEPIEETTEEPTEEITEEPTEETTEPETEAPAEPEIPAVSMPAFDVTTVPAFENYPYVEVNGNIPFFTENQYTTESYEYYSPLDALGRCGTAVANVGQDLMPTEDRGNISSVTPSGWHSVSYDTIGIDSLYNRSHLIAFQLTGENANEGNLITGTRFMNQVGMIPFENLVADYVKETGNHVLYRVTPIFEGDNLVAGGVLMEGWSVEDEGYGVCFCVYLYNVQAGVDIDYATGESKLSEDDGKPDEGTEMDYIINKRNGKFHYTYCSSVSQMSESNKQPYHGTREELIEAGYTPCGACHP